MYTRVMKQKNKDGSLREYLCILESYRENGKPKQRMIANLGRIGTEVTPEKIDVLMQHLEKHANKVSIINVLKDLESKASLAYGEMLLFRKVWNTLGIDQILRKLLSKTEKQVDYVEAMFMATCNRLKDPRSKKGVSEWKEGVYEPKWEGLALHHMYRGMDYLLSKKEAIEVELFQRGRDLFNCRVNVAMFDTTTVSYWGEGEAPIFQHGHAKNKRYDLKQLVVGIVMDQDGSPLGHEVWPGNMSDKPAFKEVIEKIKKTFLIEKVILVCDKGMVSEGNLEYLESCGYEYVLSAKLRQLSEFRQKELLKEEGFLPIGDGKREAKEMLESELWEQEETYQRAKKIADGVSPRERRSETITAYKESPKGRRRWVVCLNRELALIDHEKRTYFQKILENKVEHATAKEWIIKNGYKKYVTLKEFSIELNTDRFEQDALFDGKWCLITNTSFPVETLIKTYKELAQIEQHFRTLKSEIEIGPVFHWTERRVRAHVFICFLALQIRAYIKKQLKTLDPDLFYNSVMSDVFQLRANVYHLKGTCYVQRTAFYGKTHLAFKATGTAIPPDFISVSHIQNLPSKPSEPVVTTSL